jgi:hypothetical protein
MAFEIPDHFHKSFTTNVELLLQQKSSALLSAVPMQSYSGEAAQVVKQFGTVAFNEKASRHADTVWSDIEHKQRWMFPTDYTLALPVDKEDELRMLDSPLSPYAEAMRAAWVRKCEDVVIAAAIGTNYTGVNGSTSTAFDTTDMAIASSSVGMTVAKLREARKKLLQQFNDPSDTFYLVLSAEEQDDLLQTTEVTSADYNSVKALVNGEVNQFMGFTFIQTERLTSISAERACFAFAKSGLVMGQWNGLEARIGERADKEYTQQVFMRGTIGATRTQEKKLVRILCA